MAVTITSNKKGTSATIHVSSGSNTIVIAGNSSVSAIAKDNEIVTGAAITQVFWGADPAGYINITRGGVLVATYDSTSYYDYAGSGMTLNVNPTANIEVTFIGTANAYVFFEVQKTGQLTTNSEYFLG